MTELTTLAALQKADSWSLREFARLCGCGGPEKPFSLQAYESAKELILRAIVGKAVRVVAEDPDTAKADILYEAAVHFKPGTVVEWARRTFPDTFPSVGVFPVQSADSELSSKERQSLYKWLAMLLRDESLDDPAFVGTQARLTGLDRKTIEKHLVGVRKHVPAVTTLTPATPSPTHRDS